MLTFVASLTVCPSDIRKIRRHLSSTKTPFDPLRNILITPLFASRESLKLAEQMSSEGTNVFFDSGGYYVQIGRLRYEELYIPLMKNYKENRWASVYTLPDHVPLSQDNPSVVEQKVRDTVTFSTFFFQEMPDELKHRAMPVVQGHTYAQIDACLEAYIKLGVRRIGFGSFGTVGAVSEVNVATQSAVELAKYVIEVAHSHGIKVHTFGSGVPALVAMLKGIRADSFDSSSWQKSAGFGQVFLPFMRAYNISYKSAVSELQKGITFEQFEEWRKLTGHRCYFCDSLMELHQHKMYRAIHNLLVIAETVHMVNSGHIEKIESIYKQGSGKYRNEFQKWLRASY